MSQELVIQNYEKYYSSIIADTSQEVIEVDTLIAVIGEIVGKMYEGQNEPEPEIDRLSLDEEDEIIESS